MKQGNPRHGADKKRRNFQIQRQMSALESELQVQVGAAMALHVPRRCPSASPKATQTNRAVTLENFNRFVIQAVTHRNVAATCRVERGGRNNMSVT